ncbi:MAG: TIGR02391 family protein [Aphanothece saxicola GSE-SYN-MK-01-06B]|nr:TIGR02391 family protein [Aphanothece saxicola GSE-SYN-MK-01-06B]
MELPPEELLSLPIDQLAIIALRHIDSAPEWSAHNFIQLSRNQGLGEQASQCWAEALNWLISKNLVAQPNPNNSSPGTIFVTRLGKSVLESGLEAVKASERLQFDLHPRLERVKSQFLLGEYELGAFAAMREVEIRVRELSGAGSSLVGVKLMREAFREGGKLANPDLDPGERVGVMELFAGAIGTFKNPPSHRQVDYANPTEASEVILLADLLMRLLDRSRVEGR